LERVLQNTTLSLVEAETIEIGGIGACGASYPVSYHEGIIHLGAQPLVSKLFARPIETFVINMLGTCCGAQDRFTPICITTEKFIGCVAIVSRFRSAARVPTAPTASQKGLARAELAAACQRDVLKVILGANRIATNRSQC
jgi:hypothetical protein